MDWDEDDLREINKRLRARKQRIKRGEPPDEEINVDCFKDSFSSPRSLTIIEVKELIGLDK